MQWRDLLTDPPSGKEYCILLFPCKTDVVGKLYITSNPHYAIKKGIKSGYTHWADPGLAPTHDEWVKWQDELLKDVAKPKRKRMPKTQVPKRKVGRPPNGDCAMTALERVRLYRERKKANKVSS